MTKTKKPSRRRFLGGAAAALAMALGLPRVKEPPPIKHYTPRRNRTRDQDPNGLPHKVYLPFAQGGGRRPHGPSKLGVHTIHSGGAEDLVQQVAEAGARVALVKALDQFGYLSIVKEVSPETVTVARSSNTTCGEGIQPIYDPAEAALWKMSCFMPAWENDRQNVDYWEVLNEVDPAPDEHPHGHAWLGEFYIECMEIAEQNGYKLALFSYAVGVPELEEWEAIVDTGVFSRAKQGGHILALHEYNWSRMSDDWMPLPGNPPDSKDRGWLTGRYRHLYEEFLSPRNQVIPLVITEAGYDPGADKDEPGWDDDWLKRYVDDMAWYDDRLREDNYVIGCALFTLGPNSRWENWDYAEVKDDLRDYIISLKDAP